MPSIENHIQQTRQQLLDARARGKLTTLQAFVRLSGPGWLQSAITMSLPYYIL